MKVTEQIDAMEVSGTNPFKYLVITNFSNYLDVAIISNRGRFHCHLRFVFSRKHQRKCVVYLIFQSGFYYFRIQRYCTGYHQNLLLGLQLISGLLKGYNCKKGTAGVGKAANSAVVYTSMLLFIIDFVAVFVTNIFTINHDNSN